MTQKITKKKKKEKDAKTIKDKNNIKKDLEKKQEEHEEIIKARKQNMRIYSIYRAVSLDLIFYYAIEFLFLTQVKNITASEVVLSYSFYALFMIFLQVPASIVIDRIGTKKSTILANIFNAIFIFLIINCNGLEMLICAHLISALCFALKDISDGTLLEYSIPKTRKKGEIFARIEGKGYRNYFLFDAITAICSGFLYVINPYIPMYISLIFVIISIVMSLGFRDIEKIERKYSNNKVHKKSKRHYIKELKDIMLFITKSQRLRSILLYSGISWGIFSLISTYRSSLLVDIKTPAQIITIIAAIVGIASSIGSRYQVQFNKKFKNKSLTIILISLTLAIMISGIAGLIKGLKIIPLIIITISFIIININKGMSIVLTTRYLGNFATKKILTQIYAVNGMVKNIFRAIIGFIGSYLLDITNTANATILVGIFMVVISLSLISYMKTRLGLKPEEYDENEIYSK